MPDKGTRANKNAGGLTSIVDTGLFVAVILDTRSITTNRGEGDPSYTSLGQSTVKWF